MQKNLYLRVNDNSVIRFQHYLPKSDNTKPNILILEGRGTFIEKCNHTIKRLQDDGYEIWIFDWRGQGLSTREAGRKGFIDNYDSYLDDLDLFVRTFLKNSNNDAPVVVLGQSMGAHICLRYLSENPGMIDGAVLTAPMIEINTGIYPKRVAKLLSQIMCFLGFKKEYVFGQEGYNPITEEFEGNILTRNKEVFYQHKQLCIDRPELVIGGVTFGWVKATMKSSEQLLKHQYLEKIKVPIGIYVAEDEKVVQNNYLSFIKEHIEDVDLTVIPDSRHVLLCEVSAIQDVIHQGFNQFINKNFPRQYHKKDILSTLTESDNVYVPNIL